MTSNEEKMFPMIIEKTSDKRSMMDDSAGTLSFIVDETQLPKNIAFRIIDTNVSHDKFCGYIAQQKRAKGIYPLLIAVEEFNHLSFKLIANNHEMQLGKIIVIATNATDQDLRMIKLGYDYRDKLIK